MYSVYGVGKRIASYRKILGLTQEELAVQLNITSQAVSKWENELSFPEITILPSLANVLNTTIEKLFGNEEELLKNSSIIPKFPESMGGNLKLVHTLIKDYNRGIACYSEKEVDVTNEDTVYFKDGSSANLRQLKIVNKGAGEICFDFMDNIPLYNGGTDLSKTDLNGVFSNIDSLEINVKSANFKLVRSEDSKTYIKAEGSPVFIAGLKLIQNEGMLSIRDEQENNTGGSSGHNRVTISFGSDTGKSIGALVNGDGEIAIEVPFKSGHASINGSGRIVFTDINNFEGTINGSGDIDCSKAGNIKFSINGSGKIDIGEVSGFFKSKINGSGDINLKKGSLDAFEAGISGSGIINASEICTNKANVFIDGSGDIVIGQVIEESIEKHSRNSSIKVLKRGL